MNIQMKWKGIVYDRVNGLNSRESFYLQRKFAGSRQTEKLFREFIIKKMNSSKRLKQIKTFCFGADAREILR